MKVETRLNLKVNEDGQIVLTTSVHIEGNSLAPVPHTFSRAESLDVARAVFSNQGLDESPGKLARRAAQ